jgi:hypothetical protein
MLQSLARATRYDVVAILLAIGVATRHGWIVERAMRIDCLRGCIGTHSISPEPGVALP